MPSQVFLGSLFQNLKKNWHLCLRQVCGMQSNQENIDTTAIILKSFISQVSAV